MHPIGLVSQQDRLWMTLQQPQGTGKAAAGAAGRTIFSDQITHALDLFRAGLVIRQSVTKGIALVGAGEQCSGGSIHSKSPQLPAEPFGNGWDELFQSPSPVRWCMQTLPITDGGTEQQRAVAINHSNPNAAGPQIDTEGETSIRHGSVREGLLKPNGLSLT